MPGVLGKARVGTLAPEQSAADDDDDDDDDESMAGILSSTYALDAGASVLDHDSSVCVPPAAPAQDVLVRPVRYWVRTACWRTPSPMQCGRRDSLGRRRPIGGPWPNPSTHPTSGSTSATTPPHRCCPCPAITRPRTKSACRRVPKTLHVSAWRCLRVHSSSLRALSSAPRWVTWLGGTLR